MSAICYLLSAVCCLLSVVCCWLSAVCCLLHIATVDLLTLSKALLEQVMIRRLKSVCSMLSAVCCLLYIVCCLRSAIWCLLCSVCCLQSAIYSPLSLVAACSINNLTPQVIVKHRTAAEALHQPLRAHVGVPGAYILIIAYITNHLLSLFMLALAPFSCIVALFSHFP
jgi:hypothetical protein